MRRLALLGIFAATLASAYADGKIFGRENPPPIPYQRAFLHFSEGRELLILQTKFTGPPAELAWVIPCPAPPVFGVLADDKLFPALDGTTAPRIVRLGGRIETALFLVISILLVTRGIRAIREKRHAMPYLVAALAVVALWAVLEIPRIGSARPKVEVIQGQPAGITDLQLIRAADPEPLLKWLTEGGFSHDDADRAAISAYVTRGWCFVAVRVRAGEKSPTPNSPLDRMTAPLVLSFATPQAVYPLALTATVGAPTEVLLYVAAAGRLETDARFVVEYAGNEAASLDWKTFFDKADPPDLFAKVGGTLASAKRVTRLRAQLAPADMEEDATLAPAEADEAFRKRVFRW